ncbi:MAG: AMIN domain-containing protein [Deltaproteobacteria bacterium]|nr:AMIN domain-containing protein [Deltaproteobacteria bacterium]
MRYGRYYLRREWIFLLGWFLYTIGCPSPSSANTPCVLRDVRTVYQNGQWHVVLTGSNAMTYRTFKVVDALGVQLFVDLINTLNEIPPWPFVFNNEVSGTVSIVQLVLEPQPRTRVEISLTKDAPYRITRREEKIWVSIEKVSPISKAEGSQTEPASEIKADSPQTTTKEAQTAATSQPSPEEPQRVAEQTLPSASKILAIEPVEMDEDIDVHIIGDGRFDKYDVSLLFEPPRLVVDLLGVKSTGVKDELILSGPWAKRLRVGRHAEKVRVVFDLRFTPKGDLPFQVTVEEDRLVVSLLPGHNIPPQ